jgi:serine/threonine protein kinase
MGSSSCGLPTTQGCLLTSLIQSPQTVAAYRCVLCEKSKAAIEAEMDEIAAEFGSAVRSGNQHDQSFTAKVEARLKGVTEFGTRGNLAVGPINVNPARIGRYEVLSTLGRGGMGVVYRVRDRESHREYALKTLPDMGRAGSQTKSRFQREISSVRRLNHPAMVQYVDSEVSEESSYLVMPLIHGVDVAALVSGGKSMPLADVSEIIRQTAIGLAAAHEQMIIHRDVKPSNLMLTLTDAGQVQVKILDFGVAISRGMQSDSTLTEEGQTLGTLDYMSAEQLSNSHHVDCSSDIYSLGATAFRLLAGSTPFQKAGRSPLKLMMAIRNSNAPEIQGLCPDLPLSIAGFLNRMLDREPSYRPRSMMEIAMAFEGYTAGHQLRERLDGALLIRAHDEEKQSASTVG